MADSAFPSGSVSGRRAFLASLAAGGAGASLFPKALWGLLQNGAPIDIETIRCAEEIADLRFTDAQRTLLLEDLRERQETYRTLRGHSLPNATPPAIQFNPVPPGARLLPAGTGTSQRTRPEVRLPSSSEELAFLPVTHLAELIRTRQVGSEELTRLYLERIERYDSVLRSVVTVTEERALRQARAADQEIGQGRYRGPLHGIPWGAKDLLAVAGYPTTWGTPPFRDQQFDEDATVVRRLDAAGAVLVAKLSLGELAWGDIWFNGMTLNPWNPREGSSGSSAGPAAATAAGLVAFSIGSETLGSISTPATRTGVTGLRPTFGRIPRTGAMALAWSMDKLGPMTRSVEDCALLLDAIQGSDGFDGTEDVPPFRWDAALPLARLRIGYVREAFEGAAAGYPNRRFDLETLETLRSLGANLTPVDLPDFPYRELTLILHAEAAAAFDELTRSGRDEEMVRQERFAWPNVFRAARMIPAVEYINANRIRTQAMLAWAELFRQVDVVLVPTDGTEQLPATNLTGHPAVILPNGFRGNGTPVSITFLGGLYQEHTLLAVAHAYQQATSFHLQYPNLDRIGAV